MRIEQHRIELDEEADAAYVRVSTAPVAPTQELADGIVVDFDADNEMVGVEVLSPHDRVGTGDRASYLNGLIAGTAVEFVLATV